MNKLDYRGKWVLVTGASSGLGRELAVQLARNYGAHLIITARRKDRLETLATELLTFGAKVEVLPADLADKTDLSNLIQAVTALQPYAAILNAGVTYYGAHLAMPEATLAAILQTNIRSLVRLSEALLPALNDAHGGLLLVSSLAGIVPLPYQAAYSGSKAFVLTFGLALAEELREQNASVTVFAPGGVRTEMLASSGLARKFKAGDPALMPVATCARLALRAFSKRKTLAVPGFINKLSMAAARVLPVELLSRLTARLYKPD